MSTEFKGDAPVQIQTARHTVWPRASYSVATVASTTANTQLPLCRCTCLSFAAAAAAAADTQQLTSILLLLDLVGFKHL